MSEVSFFEFVARMYCHVDCMYSKYWGRQAFANNVDLDQITADCDIVSVSILISTHPTSLTLSLPQAIIIFFFFFFFFANGIDPDETAHYEPSHLGLRCLTLRLSTLHINFFPVDSC